VRITFTLDIERRRPEQQHYEGAPDVDSKGSYILDRAASNDFEQAALVGFCRNTDQQGATK